MRLCSLGSLSASRFDPSLSNLEPKFRTFNGQPQREACVARFEAALKQEARKVRSKRSEDQKKLAKLEQKYPSN